jgi:hypothetical protein
VSRVELAADVGARKMVTTGWMRKITGSTTMVTTIDRLRR